MSSIKDHYAVIGNPVAHSQSPFIHQLFALQTQQSMDYNRLLAPLDQFENAVRQFQNNLGKGLNVTVPFKFRAFAMADHHSLLASEAGSANTLSFREDGAIFADNTDGMGLVADFKKNLNLQLSEKNILILGAGGASAGIIGPLLKENPKCILIANRTVEKAVLLAEHFLQVKMADTVDGFNSKLNTLIRACGFDEIAFIPYDVIINATSLSLGEGEFNLIDGQIISPQSYCYDLSYSRLPTSFLRFAKSHGAMQCRDGIGMLVEQAAISFYLWRDIYPETAPVLKALKSHLQKSP